MHVLIRKEEIELVPALPDHSSGLRRAVLIGGHTGSTHTGLTLVELSGRPRRQPPALVRDDVLRARGRADALPRRARRAAESRAPAARFRSALPHAWRSDGRARWIEMASPRPRGAGRSRRTRSSLGPAPDAEPRAARRPRPAQPQPLPAQRRRHGPRPPQARRAGRRADRVGEHGDRGARLQRDHGEDARRQAARRAAADDVHGRLPAGRRRASARPSLRGVVRDARRRRRRRRRRRALHAPARRRLLDRRRLHPRLLRDRGQRGALARDVGPGPPDRHSYRFERDWEYLARAAARAGSVAGRQTRLSRWRPRPRASSRAPRALADRRAAARGAAAARA